MCLLTGCSSITGNKTNSGKETETFSSLEKEPDLSYEVPNSIPNILVNQIGYQTNSDKVAIFIGGDLPAVFQVVDSKTGEIAYTGEVENSGYGDFSELTIPGEYYVKSKQLGMSYSFLISDELYGVLFDEAQKKFEDLWSRKNHVGLTVSKSCEIAAALLLSYELYPMAYQEEEETEVPQLLLTLYKETEWLLSMQNPTTGGVYQEQKSVYEEDGEDVEATAYFAAILAKFAYNYQKIDAFYANTCLQAAKNAFTYLEKQDYSGVESKRFFAATELYRMLARYHYHTVAKEYLTAKTDTAIEEGSDFYGSMTYISTSRSVDVKLCSQIMKKLMNQAEDIANEARESLYMTVGDEEKEIEIGQLLWNMEILSVVDYIITNHEYANVIHNYQQYFLGRNEKALCFIRDDKSDNPCDEGEAIEDNLIWNAYYAVMLSQIQNKE